MNLNGTVYPSVVSENGDWFVKSDYWKRWSRSLVRMEGEIREAIDISIEPLNFVPVEPEKRTSNYEIDRLLEMRIRCHCTINSPEGFSMGLPHPVGPYVQKLVGDYFYHLLMHEDLLGEINHDKLAYHDITKNWPWGGGIPFAMVCKDRDKYAPVLEHWFKVMEKEPKYLEVQDEDMLRRYNQFINKEEAQ
jgi:hypothetical protein